jgi:hypothetical protein
VDWYCQTLGLQLVHCAEQDSFALLRAGVSQIALKAGKPVPGTVRLTFAVPDLNAALLRLAQLGVQPEGPPKASGEGYRRVRLRDPDGYQLSLFEWTSAAGGSGKV